MKFIRYALIIGLASMILLAGNYALAQNAKTLYSWDAPKAGGTTWPGWQHYPEGASDYEHWGWRKLDGKFYSGNDSNWLPRVHEKTDYGVSCQATIDTENIAPLPDNHGAFKVYDDGSKSTYQACWWYLNGQNFGDLGYADQNTDRLSFYMKVQGMDTSRPTNGDIANANMHFGTYLCYDGYCPKEGPSNQHYYHYLTVHDNAWIHVSLDRHPQHKRGMSGFYDPGNNPPASDGENYFDVMNKFYLEIRYPQPKPTAYWIDNVTLHQTEQNENDISISSVWVGYWPNTDKWEIGFNDASFASYGNDSIGTYEIRWSTSPITNNNFSQATKINPEYYAYDTGRIRRPNSWKYPAWTQFELPDSTEKGHDIIYFAIKDVSSTANGDGHNAPSPYIHTIKYHLNSTTQRNNTLGIPQNLKIVE